MISPNLRRLYGFDPGALINQGKQYVNEAEQAAQTASSAYQTATGSNSAPSGPPHTPGYQPPSSSGSGSSGTSFTKIALAGGALAATFFAYKRFGVKAGAIVGGGSAAGIYALMKAGQE